MKSRDQPHPRDLRRRATIATLVFNSVITGLGGLYLSTHSISVVTLAGTVGLLAILIVVRGQNNLGGWLVGART